MDSLSHFLCSMAGTSLGLALAYLLVRWTTTAPVEEHAIPTLVPLVKLKRIHPDAKMPFYAKHGDAGADLVSIEDVTLRPGEWRLVRTGLAIELPDGWEAQVRSRSGLALKQGVNVLNSPGTIDSGYRGEIGAVLMNHGPEFHINKGDRIAQLVIKQAPQALFVQVNELSESTRGSGGFGHTGMKS